MTTTTQPTVTCQRCHGTGIRDGEPCSSCDEGRALCVESHFGCQNLATHTHDGTPTGDPACETHREDGDAVPPPADPGRTVRIPAQSMSSLVFGEVV